MAYIPESMLHSLCTGFDGLCSVYLSVPSTGEAFTFNADKKINSASTIKIPLLAFLFKDAMEGTIDLDEPVPLGDDGVSGGSGVIKFLSPQIRLSLYDYAVLMMIYSDNTATNKIIDTLGMGRANAFFKENGWNDTVLARKMMAPIGTNLTSARDLGNILTQIYEKKLVSQEASNRMLSIMACQQLGKLDKSLPNVWRPSSTHVPVTAVPEGRVVLAQKGGTLSNIGILHDTGIMLLPNGQCAIMAVMTKSNNENKAFDFIKTVSRTVYDSLVKSE